MLKIEIEGVDDFLAAVNTELKGDKKLISKVLSLAATETHRNAVESIKRGGRHGKVYRSGTRKQHVASVEGEAPASDTGVLVKNITIEKETDGFTVGSRKGAPHGLWLEFGTSRMGARPWLQPAFDKMVKWFDASIAFGVFK